MPYTVVLSNFGWYAFMRSKVDTLASFTVFSIKVLRLLHSAFLAVPHFYTVLPVTPQWGEKYTG